MSEAQGRDLVPIEFDPFADSGQTRLPLTPQQIEVWVESQMGREASCAYNQCYVLHLRGPLSAPSMSNALNVVIGRHAALRAVFNQEATSQLIRPSLEVALPVHDLAGLPPAERQASLDRMINEETTQPFDLANGPLVRARLLRWSAELHRLVVTVHHIVCDGWSSTVLFSDLATAYAADRLGLSARLPAATSYHAYVEAEAARTDAADDEAYWLHQFANGAPVLDLPGDRPRPAVRTRNGGRETLGVDAIRYKQLKAVGAKHGATLFHTLLAAFETLMFRLSDQSDMVIGMPIAGQLQMEDSHLVAHCVSILPLRCRIAPDSSFSDFLRQVRTSVLDAQGHPNLTFSGLLPHLKLDRDLSSPPLVSVLFNIDKLGAKFDFGDLVVERVETPKRFVTFDVSVNVVDSGADLVFEFDYNTDLFDAATIQRWLGHYQVLLAEIVRDPSQIMARIDILGAQERQRLLIEGSSPRCSQADAPLVHGQFEAQVARTPSALALVAGDARLQYAELNDRANRLAHHLRGKGVGRGDLVGICLERTSDLVVALLAVLKAGAAYLPLDPNYPADRITFMLEDARAKVLVTVEALAPAAPTAGTTSVLLDRHRGEIAIQPTANPEPVATAANLAYVIYTSGSTGKPKGVQVTHGALVNFLWSMKHEPGLTSTDVLAAVTTISFDIAGLELYLPLIVGARIELVSREIAADGVRLAALLDECGATVLQATPSTWRMLLDDNWKGRKGLRALCGGEGLPRDLANALLERVGELWNLYGPTETTIWSTLERVQPGAGSITIGRPIANTQIYVLDAAGQPQPVGLPGEIWIGGDGVAAGYHRRPELTAERFVTDRFSGRPNARLYRTGDLGRWQTDGRLQHLGRLDHQVKVRGFRIELGEIETAIASAPGVSQTAVVVREDTEGDKRIVAYVVTAGGAGEDLADALRAKLGLELPSYMVPSYVVRLDALPLTANGKLDRAALPAPKVVERPASKKLVSPKTPTEEAIVGIWRQVLNVNTIDCTDDFFRLGGHSLLATKVASRLRDVFQIEFPLGLLFTDTTVQTLGRRVDQILRDQLHVSIIPRIEAKAADELDLLSWSQQRMWLINKLAPDNKAYNIPVALRLIGRLDREALSHAIGDVRRRHEILRTTYHMEGDYPIQVVAPWTSERLETIDLRTMGTGAWDKALGMAHENAGQAFELDRAAPIRSILYQIGDEDHLFVITVHHIAIDDWGIHVLGHELTDAYKARRAGDPVDLPPTSLTYLDYASWQRRWIDGEAKRQLAYWRQQLTGIAPLELPTDHPRPEIFSFNGNLLAHRLPDALIGKLEALGHRTGATLFMVMFGAFATLMHRLSGQSDFAIAVPIANRLHSDAENLVGTFVNTLALRTDPARDQSFGDFLHQVRRVCLDAYAHQDVSFERLVEDFGSSRDASRPPLAQVIFNLLNSPAVQDFKMAELETRIELLDLGAAQFELGVTVDISVMQSVIFEYNSDLFDRATIERLASQYLRLLERVVANPDERLGDLPLQSESEQDQVVRVWNATDAAYPADTPLSRLFEQSAVRNETVVALSCERESLTYSELNGRANRLARRLMELKAGPGTFVALCMPRSLDLVTSLLAIQKTGAAYVPLDPGFPADRLTYMLADSGASVLLTAQDAVAGIDVPDGVQVIDLAAETRRLAMLPATNLDSAARPGDLAYVIYTSGSTGKPKGVQVTHGALVNFLWSMKHEPGLTSTDVLAAVTTISFDIAGLELYLPLIVGARIELVSREIAADGARLAALLDECGATVLQATPSTWRMLLDDNWKGRKGLRALCGGEGLPRDLANALLERVGELWNLYGPTETTIWSTLERVQPGAGSITIGRPIANTQIYVLDAAGQPQPVGLPGEIWIGGDGVAAGYHRRPELTAERFVMDRFSGRPNARLYRTGDLGRWQTDGRLQHLGRLDHQVKIRGFRIELGEIEAELNSHAAVRQSAVITREVRPGDVRIVAYIVVRAGEDLTVSDARRHLRTNLPDYMVPSFVLTVTELPLTANGKLDRAALPDPFKSVVQSEVASEPPLPGMEQRVAEIWREALKIETINAGDNFFDLGGHSLLAVRVAVALEKQTGWRMNPRVLFFQTLRQVAANAEAMTLQPMPQLKTPQPKVGHLG